MARRKQLEWPVLTHYDQDHLARIALPLGGIGTGTVSLGGRGNLRDWEIMDFPAKGFTPDGCLFALYAKPAGKPAVARCLEGPIPFEHYEEGHHGYPRFQNCSFDAAYPFGQVHLSDPDVPVDVTLQAFNPLIPADADNSGIPMAVLRYRLRNRSRQRVKASVCGTLQNLAGTRSAAVGGNGAWSNPREVGGTRINRFKKKGGLRGITFGVKDLPLESRHWGTMALTSSTRGATSYRTAWASSEWRNHLWKFWQDFAEDGALEELPRDQRQSPMGSLVVGVNLAPGEEKDVEFMVTWHFPNRGGWRKRKADELGVPETPVGKYYAAQYKDAWDVAVKTLPKLRKLEEKTAEFVRSLCESDLPQAVKEGALNNVSTLRTQTVFRTADGRMFGWEGSQNDNGSCSGSCTHVWNYEQSTAFLFGELAKTMRDVEFMHATGENGQMSFRVALPLADEKGQGMTAADGQMGCLMKLYRDWQLSGDDAMLKTLWPKARKALSYCWLEGGWDADQDGVMEGCQHNTMDVAYHGPNPQMTGWYLGALRACEEMARYLGDDIFANKCGDLFKRGSAWMDANLFNGDYYEHEIRLPEKGATFAPGIPDHEESSSDWQLGGACLVDQLVGQYMAHVCGLGYLHGRGNVRKTLTSIYKHNFKKSMHDHMNNMHMFALQEESATLMATYPRGNRPKRPFPYFATTMTGFEYTAAIGMLYEGQTKRGLELVQAIRDRYDGRKRNPFDETECGHHYARAMAAWAAIPALTGFQYSGVEKVMTFAPQTGRHVWSTGYAWGSCVISECGEGHHVELLVRHGSLPLRSLRLTGTGEARLPRARVLGSGKSVFLTLPDIGCDSPPETRTNTS